MSSLSSFEFLFASLDTQFVYKPQGPTSSSDLHLKMQHFAVFKIRKLGSSLEVTMLQSSHKDCGSISLPWYYKELKVFTK